MEDIYKKLYEDDLKLISAEVFKDHFVFDGVNKVDREEYDKFIDETITNMLSSGEDIDEDIKTQFVFRTPTIPYNIMRKYNREDGRGTWGVIDSKNYRYEIVRSTILNKTKLNKTKSVKERKNLEEESV